MKKIVYLGSMGLLAVILWVDFFGPKSMTGQIYNNSAIYLPVKVIQWLCFLAGLQIVFDLKDTIYERYVKGFGEPLIYTQSGKQLALLPLLEVLFACSVWP